MSLKRELQVLAQQKADLNRRRAERQAREQIAEMPLVKPEPVVITLEKPEEAPPVSFWDRLRARLTGDPRA